MRRITILHCCWNWPELDLFEAHNTGQKEQVFYTTALVSQKSTGIIWECEYLEHYLHPRSQEQCPACQVSRADAPDARMREVLAQLDELPASLQTFIQQAWADYQDGHACQMDGLVEPA